MGWNKNQERKRRNKGSIPRSLNKTWGVAGSNHQTYPASHSSRRK